MKSNIPTFNNPTDYLTYHTIHILGSRLPSYIGQRGLVQGLRLYSHFKRNLKTPIKLPWLKHAVRFRGGGDAKIFEQIFIDREYEFPISFEPRSIIDLGANVGYAALFFANRYPGAQIFSLEPESSNFEQAVLNTKLYPNIRMVQGAVWHEPAMINLVDKGLGEASFMVESGPGQNDIRAYTCAEIMEMMQIETIDILKIDIEGAEKNLFELNYQSWLPRTRVLMIETHDRYREGCSQSVYDAIGQFNFSKDQRGENLIFCNLDL